MDKSTSESLSISFSIALVSVSLELDNQKSMNSVISTYDRSESIFQLRSSNKHATYTSQQATATTMSQNSIVSTAIVKTKLSEKGPKISLIRKSRQSVIKDTMIGIVCLMGFQQR